VSHRVSPVRLVALSPAVVSALADADLERASTIAGLALTPYFVAEDGLFLWRFRRRQIATDPASARWIARAVVEQATDAVVGFAGFHGPPDAAGMVEVGYSIDPAWRRRGFARAALEALLERAATEPSVHTVRASVRPDNPASRALILGRGFVQVGEQWDDRDGVEIIYEMAAGTPVPTAHPTPDHAS
jgi:[ribosomal protein S5]-alanine N-acetyltransferase